MKIEITQTLTPAARKIFSTFNDAGVEIRVVGGTVRDMIMGRPINDIDFATPAIPAEVTQICVDAGFSVHATGESHGTLTVVVGGEPFEITTLRQDVETDGRRAVVAFTDDWAVDAYRRDFRFNALYMGPDGTVYDYSPDEGGIRDARERKITFMGDARERIREDYLRILRLFRFMAVLNADADIDALNACAELRDGIDTLSGERLEKEMTKLLNAEDRSGALVFMDGFDVFEKIFGYKASLTALCDNLTRTRIMQKVGLKVDPLAVVMAGRPVETAALMNRWKSSNELRERVEAVVAAGVYTDLNALTKREIVEEAYRSRKSDLVVARLALTWATDDRNSMLANRRAADRVRDLADFTVPVFPVQGRDVLALGVKPGRQVGDLLRRVEDRWVAANFTGDVTGWLREEITKVID